MTEVDNTDVRPDQDAEAWLSRSVRLLIVSRLLVMLTKSCSKCKVKCNRCYLWLESQGKFMEISYCLQHVSCSKINKYLTAVRLRYPHEYHTISGITCRTFIINYINETR
jgi:hypothetical protein